MAAITPQFLFDMESNMRKVFTNEYQRLNANPWWNLIMRRMPSMTKAERIVWLLDTAKIERPNATRGGGQAIFEDIVSPTTEYEALNATAGLTLK